PGRARGAAGGCHPGTRGRPDERRDDGAGRGAHVSRQHQRVFRHAVLGRDGARADAAQAQFRGRRHGPPVVRPCPPQRLCACAVAFVRREVMEETMNHRHSRAALVLTGAILIGLVAPAWAGDPVDLAAAKKEGKVVWYTSTPISTANKIVKAFETETGIKVELFRSGGDRKSVV